MVKAKSEEKPVIKRDMVDNILEAFGGSVVESKEL